MARSARASTHQLGVSGSKPRAAVRGRRGPEGEPIDEPIDEIEATEVEGTVYQTDEGATEPLCIIALEAVDVQQADDEEAPLTPVPLAVLPTAVSSYRSLPSWFQLGSHPSSLGACLCPMTYLQTKSPHTEGCP